MGDEAPTVPILTRTMAHPKSPIFTINFFRRHLESIRPLFDDNEYNKFVQLSQEFEATLGTRLQRWLKLKWLTSDNYVSDWWEEYVYLRGKIYIIFTAALALRSHGLVIGSREERGEGGEGGGEKPSNSH